MTLLTIDEARRLVIASAGAVLAYASCDNRRLEAVLWGHDDFEGESLANQALAPAHRRVLDHVERLGFGSDMASELEGICSAAGLENGRRDYDFVFEVLGDEPFDLEGAEPFWPWPFAA